MTDEIGNNYFFYKRYLKLSSLSFSDIRPMEDVRRLDVAIVVLSAKKDDFSFVNFSLVIWVGGGGALGEVYCLRVKNIDIFRYLSKAVPNRDMIRIKKEKHTLVLSGFRL